MTLQRRTLLLATLPWPALAGAAPPTPSLPLRFPQDYGAHPAQAIEWWYLTGWLADPAAPQQPLFGYQLTFFRLPGPAPAGHGSALAARQLMLGHVALSDLRAGRQQHDQRLMRALPGVAEAAVGDCRVRLRDWTLSRRGNGYVAAFNAEGWALSLQLDTPDAPLLQGEQGHSRKGPAPGQFSLYYSRPQLQTQATLTRAGQALTLSGRSWLDHEWSDNLLGQAVGWDWLGINLHDGRALTLFQLRRADGGRSFAGGSLRMPGQPDRSFAPDEVAMQPTRHWTSPATGTRWPVAWTLQSPAGALTLEACLDAQEIDARGSSGLVYWEGLARLRDAAGREIGLGYLELTGYAGKPPLDAGR